jgi:hypothetical protein
MVDAENIDAGLDIRAPERGEFLRQAGIDRCAASRSKLNKCMARPPSLT